MKTHTSLPLGIRAQLYQQLAQLETAGLPVDRAFAVLDLPTAAKPRLTAMRSLMKRVEFAVAGERSGLFTTLETRLIRAAMNAGSPARVYKRLADFYSTRAMQAAKLKSRMVMPVAVFLLALCIEPLPGLVTGTTGVLSYLAQVFRPLIGAGIIGLGICWLASNPNPLSSFVSKRLLGGIGARQSLRDYFETLGLMLEAGIPMFDALPLAFDTVSDAGVRDALAPIAPRVITGATLAQSIAQDEEIGSRASHQQLIEFVTTGEASGTLPEMLLRHAAIETATIDGFYTQFADWAPRIVYGLVMLWMAASLLGGKPPPLPPI